MRRGTPVRGDGDGWCTCSAGHRHWGLHGAAGLLLVSAGEVLLQYRAEWSHHGGTWGLPGGARDSGESASIAALREAHEEVGIEPGEVEPTAQFSDDHGGWSYRTVLARPLRDVTPHPHNEETIAVDWVPTGGIARPELHPGLAVSWPALWPLPAPLSIIVDAANVVGSRPDGWWRDRVGATERLIERLRPLGSVDADGGGGVGAAEWGADDRFRLFAAIDVVVEGAARGVGDCGPLPGGRELRVHRAPGSGDDTVVERVRRRAEPDAVVVAVTADRALAQRCQEAGAQIRGPQWINQLTEPSRAP